VISPRMLALLQCPDCGKRISQTESGYVCEGCHRVFAGDDHAFIDLRPKITYTEQTKYLDEALHGDARHETVSPPLLSAAIRNDMLRAFLRPEPHDSIVDLGCGSGRTLVWNRDLGAHLVGIDVSPFFAREALAETDLALGDLRQLPFANGSFTKAYALDVFEHLSRDSLSAVLADAARILMPNGALFVYSHVRKNASIAGGLRFINKVAARLDRAGAIDLAEERLRKSDHLNPLADIPDLEAVAKAAGFRIERIRYYTPLIGGFVENILVRLAARRMERRHMARTVGTDLKASKLARAEAKERIASRGPTYFALRVLTVLMKLDVLLFGRIRSGPFFALLVKEPS
jgi:SAM-dependent methyltransferase